MGKPVLRISCLVAAILFASGLNTASARGPGGPGGGGPGGARSGGGASNHSRERSKPETDKKDSSKFNANGFQPNNVKPNGESKTAKKLNNNPGNFKNGEFNPQQIQTRELAGQKKWQPADAKLQQKPQSPFRDRKNGPQPFSADWYTAHPSAWQSTRQHADAWAAASATGVAAWLGWGAQPTYATSNTVVYQQAPADESDSTSYADTSNTDTSTDDSEWLSIGVYSVLAKSGEATSRLLQLSCNRQGDLRGVEYDSITGKSENLSGRIDQSSKIAEWQLDSNSQITFRANLSDLTQATGTIEVSQQGNTQQWRISRQESGS